MFHSLTNKRFSFSYKVGANFTFSSFSVISKMSYLMNCDFLLINYLSSNSFSTLLLKNFGHILRVLALLGHNLRISDVHPMSH